jgi:hypothetical protein
MDGGLRDGGVADGGAADAGDDAGIPQDGGPGDGGPADSGEPKDGGEDAGVGLPTCPDLTETETATSRDRNDTAETAQTVAGPGAYGGELQHGADVDVFAFEVAAPGTLIRIAVDVGAGPMDAHFTVTGPREKPALVRAATRPTSRDVSREIFFPAAGTYLLAVQDERNLSGAPPIVEPATFCYTLRIEERPLPAPTDLDLPTSGTVTAFFHDVTAEGLIGFARVSTGRGGFLAPYVFNLTARRAVQGAGGEATHQPDVDPIVTLWDPVERRVVAENDDVVPAVLGVENRNANLAATLVAEETPREYWVVLDHFGLQDADGNGLETELTLTIEAPLAMPALPFQDATRQLSPERQAQWYLVATPPGRLLTAHLDGTAGSLTDVGVGVEDVSGRSLGFSAPFAALATVEDVALATDRTLVLVTSFDDLLRSGASGAYTLTVRETGSCPPIPGAAVPSPGDLTINEVLWAPDLASGDANQDGHAHLLEDELVEIINAGSGRLDLGGVSLGDVAGESAGPRHVFPCGTTLGGGQPVVVFGGGAPPPNSGTAAFFTANLTLPCEGGGAPRSLCLNDLADEGIVLRAAPSPGEPLTFGVEFARLQFAALPDAPIDGSLFLPGVSYLRCGSSAPAGAADCDDGFAYVRHDVVPGVAAPYSPGARVDGSPFPPPPGEVCASAGAIAPPAMLTDQSTLGFANDYSGTECTQAGTSGPDRIYSVAVPASGKLVVTATPTDGLFNPALYVVAAPAENCDLRPRPCLTGADGAGPGQPESVSFTNATSEARVVYVVVDSAPLGGGDFALDVSVDTP